MSDYLDPLTWRSTTIGGVPVRLVSRTGVFEEEQASATEVYLVHVSDFVTFVKEFLPQTTLIGDFLEPLPTAPQAGNEALRARRISYKNHIPGKPIDPFGIDSEAPANTYHPILEVTVDYDTEGVRSTDQFVRVTGNATGEFISTTGTTGGWKDDAADPNDAVPNKEANIPLTVIVPEMEWTITWARINPQFFEDVLIKRLRSAMGKVNNAQVSFLFNARAETLLFVGYGFEQNFTWRDGQILNPPVSLELKFLEKNIEEPGRSLRFPAVGHNDFWRPGIGWKRWVDPDGNPLYGGIDMDVIFKRDGQQEVAV